MYIFQRQGSQTMWELLQMTIGLTLSQQLTQQIGQLSSSSKELSIEPQNRMSHTHCKSTRVTVLLKMITNCSSTFPSLTIYQNSQPVPSFPSLQLSLLSQAIKFQLSPLLYYTSSTYHPAMLASRIITTLRRLTLTIHNKAYFSWESEPSTPLVNQITSTKSFADFLRVYNSNRRDCSGDVIGSASRHINGLIALKDRIQYKDIGEIVKSITQSDLSTISDKSIAGILSILRSLKSKNIMSPAITTLKNALLSKYIGSLKGKLPVDMDINILVTIYYEAAVFKNYNECRIIAEKLARMLEGEEKVTLPYNQVTFLMHAFTIREDLTFTEIRIRRILMKQVQNSLPTLKLNDLVKFASKVNKLDSFDFNSEEFLIAKQLVTKILAEIEEIQERSVYELLKGEFVSKYHGFYKIYQEICKNVFDEIDERGATNIGPDAIFKVLGMISDKMNIDKFPLQSQQKLFKFLERYAEDCMIDERKQKDFTHNLCDLVRNNFFSAGSKERVVKIIQRKRIPLHAPTLYEMALNGYNISPFFDVLARFKLQEIKTDDFVVKLGIIAIKIKQHGNTNPQVAEFLAKVEERIAALVATPQKFIAFVKYLSRNSQLKPSDFHQYYGHLIQALPNPLQKQLSIPSYRHFYLFYNQQATKQRQFNAFLIKHQPSILLEQFITMLNSHSHKQLKPSDYRRSLLQALSRRLPEILQSKNKRYIDIATDFLSKYNRAVVYGCLDASAEMSLFKVINIMISKLDLLASTENGVHFCYMLDKYLTRNYRRFNLEQNYKNFVKNLVANMDKIAAIKKGTLRLVLEEGLRLNLLTKKTLENIDLQGLGISFYNKSRIMLIKNENDTATIQTLNYRGLEIAFSNPNYQKFVTDNEAAILAIIKQTNYRELAHYLTFYSLHRSASGRKILGEILTNLAEKLASFDRIDINGIFSNALEKGFYTFHQFKRLAEKAIEEFRRKMSSYSVESHMELIRFIISQPTLNPREYYNQLAEYAEKSQDIKENLYDQLIVRLASTNYAFKEHQLKAVNTLLSSNIHSSLYLFLMVERLIQDDSARSNYVQQYIEKHTELFSKRKEGSPLSINKTYYLYLKKTYPLQTANWNIEQAYLYTEKYSVKNNNTQLIALIEELSGAKYEEVTEFGPENHFYKLKNCVFTFFFPRKLGSYYEHDFVKRLVRVVKGQEVTPVCLNLNTNNYNIIEYLNKECPSLFDQQALTKTLQQMREAHLARKEKKGEAEAEAEIVE